LEEKGVEKPYPVGASISQETSVAKYLKPFTRYQFFL